MADVLLTYGWVRSSYSALRNLSSHGVQVFATDSHKFGMCQFSRLKSGFGYYRSHYEDECGFVDDIAEMADEQKVKLIFPSHNETEILAKHRCRFGEVQGSLLPNPEHCALFNNKSRSYEFARSVGVPVPERIEYSAPHDLARLIEDLGFRKTVIKLLTGNSAKGVFYADSAAQAQEIVLGLIETYELTQDRYPQVEEYVEGEGWGSSVLYWNGKFIAGFTHRRLKEKISTGGTSTLRESAAHSAMEAATVALFNAIGWHGLAMAEYKVCPKTGKFWFVEVNPRMWGSIPLAISAGVEFPYLAWLCATEGVSVAERYHASRSVQLGWRGRWLLGDTLVAAKELVSLRPLTAARSLFLTKSDSLDDFYWDDPVAFLGEALYYASNSLVNMSLNPSEKGMVG